MRGPLSPALPPEGGGRRRWAPRLDHPRPDHVPPEGGGRRRWAPLLALALSGCGIVYTNVRTPHAYRTATPSEVKTSPDDPVVSGQACNRSLLYLVAWGDAGYATASRDALQGREPGAILYDVKTDIQATAALLGLYVKICTVVRGRVGKL